jgi:hypothetical protein
MHPAYRLELLPRDFHDFGPLKPLKGIRSCRMKVQETVVRCFMHKGKEFFGAEIHRLVHQSHSYMRVCVIT